MAALIVVIVIVVSIAVLVLLTYNALVRLRNRVEAAWAQIDVQLQRRYNLIPNVVAAVKGYATHEASVLESVIAARAKAIAVNGVQNQAQAENVLTGAMKSLFAVAESYPQLKADANFRSLQDQLADSENRIAYARQAYNDSVQTFNTRVQTFPTQLLAGPLGFREREFFESDETARSSVNVDFT